MAHGLIRLYGRHAVLAALKNKARKAQCLYGTKAAIEALKADIPLPPGLHVEENDKPDLVKLVPDMAPVQGLVLDVFPLPAPALEDFAPIPGRKSVIVMLDQVEDPRNVGAIMRTAAAFGARCLVTQTRHSPPETGTLARAASGALDLLPWVRVTNLAASLEHLAKMGYWRIGLAGEGQTNIAQIDLGDALVLVLGAEGAGLRPLVRKQCDALAYIPMQNTGGIIDSLNVSNAAAIALHRLC